MKSEEIEQSNLALSENLEEMNAKTLIDSHDCSSYENLQGRIDSCKSFIIKEVSLLTNTINTDVLLIIFENTHIEYSCVTSEFKELKKKIEESTIIPQTCPLNVISLCDPFMVFTLIIGTSFQFLLIYLLHKSFLTGDRSIILLSILILVLSSTIVLWFIRMLNQSKKKVLEAWESRKAELCDNKASTSSISSEYETQTTAHQQTLKDLEPNTRIKNAVHKLSQLTHNTKVILIIKNNTSVFTCATPSLELFLKNLNLHGCSGSNHFKDFFNIEETFPIDEKQKEVSGNIHSDDQLVLTVIYTSLLVLWCIWTRKFKQL